MEVGIISIAILGFILLSGFVYYRRFLYMPQFKKCPQCGVKVKGVTAKPLEPLNPLQVPFLNKTHVTPYTGGWVFPCPACSLLFDKNETLINKEFLKF